MASEMRLLVITPDQVLMDRPVASVRAPGIEGLFGVLPGHAPMVAAVAAGELRVVDTQGSESVFFVGDGFLEVRDNRVRLVVDSGETVTEIDLERAREAEKRARERLSLASKQEDLDLPRAEYSMRRAMERTRIARKYRV
jgi:F-type H+-transporting ATPase subunit epsilon